LDESLQVVVRYRFFANHVQSRLVYSSALPLSHFTDGDRFAGAGKVMLRVANI
jgi:hypothetical protein